MAGSVTVREHRSWFNTELVRSWLESLFDCDGRAGAVLAPDVVLVMPPSLAFGGSFTGSDRLAEFVALFCSKLTLDAGVRHSLQEVGDDEVVVHTTGVAYAVGSALLVDLDVRTFVTVDAGRISCIRSYWRDTAAVVRLIGVNPAFAPLRASSS